MSQPRAIDEIKQSAAEFENKQKQRIAQIQKKCKHLEVGHWGGEYDSGSLDYPIRVCLNCGVEEEGSWWSYSGRTWSRKEFDGKPILGPTEGRTFKEMSFDTFRQHRI